MKIAREYLKSNGWNTEVDEKGRDIYFKHKPETPLLPFRQLGKKRDIDLVESLNKLREFFSRKGYSGLKSSAIANPMQDTLFIGAGLQAVSNRYGIDVEPGKQYFIAQPCLRVSAIDKVPVKDGYSTSFVNVCTEQFGVTEEQHIAHLENWLDLLSGNGIYTGHLRLVEDPNWSGGTNMEGKSLLVYYSDLQIGDAVFVTKKDSGERVSDIGFGLERICWALSKSDNYFDNIGPYFELKMGGKFRLDMLRSLTLMALEGITSTNHNAGYRFKQFAKAYLGNSNEISPKSEIDYYANFWKNVISSDVNSEAGKMVIGEIHKNFISRIGYELKISTSSSDFQSFIRECRTKYPQKIPQIEAFIIKLGRNNIS